jgi:transcriptional regulator GlxA family with amidase domain
MIDVAFLLYDNFTSLDVIGPWEVISQWPDTTARFVAMEDRPVTADTGLTVVPTTTTATVAAPDIVVVGGSSRPFGPLEDQALLDWVKGASASATWMASVCTGASIYAAAGLLGGRRATTHWAFRPVLASMGVKVSTDRVVLDEPFISGAGVSAGIDMALTLTGIVHGDDAARQIQLILEYEPRPPYDAGSPEAAGPDLVQATLEAMAAHIG